jgi:hypothetical protein
MHHGVECVRGDAIVVALSHTVIGQVLLMLHGSGSISHWGEVICRLLIGTSPWALGIESHPLGCGSPIHLLLASAVEIYGSVAFIGPRSTTTRYRHLARAWEA